ncbi:YhcN/YlaJ family sporulation lipoprotein [Bacillus sp. B190/17]|uniref:YhcN/YlaJ family sporulation lipoprotein n=1 Tax=Bacillus lumedeiriae TaxID=3058829 RepID=A0ABW8IAG6_9BACI
MKKPLLIAGFSSFLMLAACNANDTNQFADNTYDRNGATTNVSDRGGMDGNTVNVNDRYGRDRYDMYNGDNRLGSNELMTKKRQDNFGYVRQQKSPIQGETVSYREIHTMDRERMADSISKLSVSLPAVNDSSVLVTDEEVLIAYDTDTRTNKDRKEVADQVKKTALSVVPRWYNVYVTDDTGLRRDIENIAQTNGGMTVAQDDINRTIKLMKQNSPQGYTESKTDNTRNNEMRGTNKTPGTTGTPTGTPGTIGTPGTNWTTGPTDQGMNRMP